MNNSKAQWRRYVLPAAALLGVGIADSAQAQPAPSGGQGDVVITARKKTESLQKVPVAVTVQTSKDLETKSIRQVSDLGAFTPSLTTSQPTSTTPTGAGFALRGQSAADTLLTSSLALGIYEDSVNIPHPDGTDGSFFDLQRVEVLKGPQGTLYGRNTTGGAINIITRNADYKGIHGFVTGEYGNYNDWKVGGAVNVPIIDDVLSARAAYQHWNRDGFGKSLFSGQKYGSDRDDDVARLSVRFDPTSNLTSTTKVEYFHANRSGPLSKLVEIPAGSSSIYLEAAVESGQPAPTTIPLFLSDLAVGQALVDPLIANQNPFENYTHSKGTGPITVWHGVEDVSWNINDDLKLRSITGYHNVLHFDQPVDLGLIPYHIINANPGVGEPCIQPLGPSYDVPCRPETKYEAYTQEFNLSGSSFGRLDWLLGAYGSTEVGSGSEYPELLPALTNFGTIATSTSDKERTSTWAIFTQNDIHLSDRVYLTLGARYTEEREEDEARLWTSAADLIDPTIRDYTCVTSTFPINVTAAAPGNDPFSCPTLYGKEKATGTSYLASFNYQITPSMLLYLKTARGFRGGAIQFRLPDAPPVNPEIATDYEIGFKGDFFNHRLRTNFAAYHTNYANKQQTLIINNPNPTTVLVNAADAKIDGFEGEITAMPIKDWSVYGTFSYLHGQYNTFGNSECAVAAAAEAAAAAAHDNVALAAAVQDAFNNKCALDSNNVPFDASGLSFSDPKWRYSVGTRYEHDLGPGRLGGQVDWSWHSKTVLNRLNYASAFSADLNKRLNDSLGLMNARVDYTLPDQGITVALFATNLLDKRYQYPFLLSGALGLGSATTGDPRMFGVQLTKKFGDE